MKNTLKKRLALAATIPALATGLAVVAPALVAAPAFAANCVDCQPGSGGSGGGAGGGTGSGTTVPAMPTSGTGGGGSSYGWNGASQTSRYVTEHLHTNPIDGHSAWWMDTNATLDKQTGVVQHVTHTEDDNWFGGFTGGMFVVAMDSYGNILGHTDTQTYGVNGTWETAFGPSARDDQAPLTMQGANLGATTRLEVVQWHDATNRLLTDLDYIKSVLDSATSIGGELAQLAGYLG